VRIDGKGGSRIVACPECGAKVGERCKSDGAPWKYRTQSHARRAGKARALLQKREREKRLSFMETEGARRFLNACVRDVPLNGLPNFGEIRGAEIASEVAVAAIERLLKTRGARGPT
jgi:hypothetical protein